MSVHSIRFSLTAVIAACVLPMALVTAALVVYDHDVRRERAALGALHGARSLLAALRQEPASDSDRRLQLVGAGLPDGWAGAVLDRNGGVLASTDGATFAVGSPAPSGLRAVLADRREGTLESGRGDPRAVIYGFSRIMDADPTVVVVVPLAPLVAELKRSLAWLLAGTLMALAIGFWVAARVARRMSRSVRGLIDPALALGRGQAVELPPTELVETQSVGEAIARASEMLTEVQHLAHHDGLTGLCNRVLFEKLAERHILSMQRNDGQFAVLLIDLDGFKGVNDQHGHAVGDRVLKEAALRIVATIRAADIAARIGGDEFVVLLENADARSASVIAQALIDVLSVPYTDVLTRISASVGIAPYPGSGSRLDTLLDAADRAMYSAKASGKARAAIAPAGQ